MSFRNHSNSILSKSPREGCPQAGLIATRIGMSICDPPVDDVQSEVGGGDERPLETPDLFWPPNTCIVPLMVNRTIPIACTGLVRVRQIIQPVAGNHDGLR